MDRYDVVIIGGGPSGSAAAIACIQSGLKVLVVKGSLSCERPGESLHPGIEPLLDQLGVGDKLRSSNFLRFEGIWSEWGGERQFIKFGSDEHGPWQGYQACGSEFDGMLMGVALEQGVQIIHECFAVAPLIENERVIGVKTTVGDIQSKWLLDCTGRKHWLARKLKLKIQHHSPRFFIQYGYVYGSCQQRNESPLIVGNESGWTWTAQVKPKVYQWTQLDFENKLNWNTEWRPHELRNLEPIGKPSGVEMTWRIVTDSAGPGYFILGDAASVLDPASSHGVQKAIMSAMMAVHCITSVTQALHKEKIVIEAYKNWYCDWFFRDKKELRDKYLLICPKLKFIS